MLIKWWWWCIFANSESSDLALSLTCLSVCAWPFSSPIDFPPFSLSFLLSSIDQICISLQITSFTNYLPPFTSQLWFSSLDQIFPFSKCFHPSNALLSFTSPFSLPSLNKNFPSPFYSSFVGQILSFYLSSSWNILHEAPLASQKLKKKKTNMLRNFIGMTFLFYITNLTCLKPNSLSLKEKC